MKKLTKLRICDQCLLLLLFVILTSGIQLEATHSRGRAWVWIHIAVGLIFMGFAGWHIFLHFGKSNWFGKFHKLKQQFTRILWGVTLLTLLSGIIAAIHWTGTFSHAPVGGIHGKIGFLMIALSLGHIAKRIKFFKHI